MTYIYVVYAIIIIHTKFVAIPYNYLINSDTHMNVRTYMQCMCIYTYMYYVRTKMYKVRFVKFL